MRLLEFCKVSEYYIRTLPKAERDDILKTPEPDPHFKSPRAQITKYKEVPSPVIPDVGREETVLNEDHFAQIKTPGDEEEMEAEHQTNSEQAPESAYESGEEPMSSIDQISEPSVTMPIIAAKNQPIYEDISDPEDEPDQQKNNEKELKRERIVTKQEAQEDKFAIAGHNFEYNEELSDHESLADGPLGVDFPPPSPEPKPYIDRNLILPPRGYRHALMHPPKAPVFEHGQNNRQRFMLNPFWHHSHFQQSLSREGPGAHPAERQAPPSVPNRSAFRHQVPTGPLDYSHSLYPQFPVFHGIRNEFHSQEVQEPRPRQSYPSHNQQPPPHQRMPPPFHMFVPPPIPPVYYPYALYPPREFDPYQQAQHYAAHHAAQQNNLQNSNFQQPQSHNQYRSQQPRSAPNYHPPKSFKSTNFTK